MRGDELGVQYRLHRGGFNPCCIGLAIAGVTVYGIAVDSSGFQSLLYWISHCGTAGDTLWGVAYAFQSLLYWISHCGPVRAGGCSRPYRSFNPCCIGLAIAGRILCGTARTPQRFQSLLYWISHCGYATHDKKHGVSGVSILVVLD